MEITKKTRFQLILQNWIFIVLFLAVMGLLGWLSVTYTRQFDWTATGRNSLTTASLAVIKKLKDPVYITSYASSDDLAPIRSQIREIIKRYQNKSKNIHLSFVDPLQHPDEVRKLNIRTNGEMIIKYQGRSEQVSQFTEENITNAMQRLLRNAERKIVFITGHGERNPEGHANADLGDFFNAVESKGFKVSTLNLTKSLMIPPGTSVLVISSPQLDYLPGEITTIKKYLADGGNLWWQQEPENRSLLKGLADDLHIKFMNGVIVDPDIRLLGVTDPTIIMGQYLPQTITDNFNVLTLYPRVTGIDYQKDDDWKVTPFLESVNRSWLETGPLKGTIRFDAGKDIKGPVKFALAMTREIKTDKSDKTKDTKDKTRTQRAVVMGDGDFMSNGFLGNQGNQEMAENILNWLTHDDNFINIPPAKAPDAHLSLEKNSMILLGIFYYLVITSLLIGAGIFVWLRRRKR